MRNDVLIKNGLVMDGTGKPAFKADVLIHDDRIEEIGDLQREQTDLLIEANGLVVAPGFIDVHSHLDFLLPSLWR